LTGAFYAKAEQKAAAIAAAQRVIAARPERVLPRRMLDSPSAPFAFGDGPDACLLLHGFSGAPSEMRPLGERLAKRGMRVSCPLLPGHGVSARELHRFTRGDLLDAARAALAELGGARRIYLAGLSAGALLALEMAAGLRKRNQDPQLSAMALLAPAIRFAGTTWFYAEALGRLPVGRAPIFLSKGKRDITSSMGAGATDELRADGSLTRAPLSWARELRLLSRESLAVASRVRTPTLILHGGRDQTAASQGSRILAGRLGSPIVDLRFFPESGHVLPIDRDGPVVCDAVADFFARAQ